MRMPVKSAGARLPGAVWALGLVSFFMDVSSEMIHGLLPAFLVGALGVTPFVVGLIDGAAEALAYVTKLFSGTWSDRLGRRKPLLLAGYGLAAFSKPLFPLAESALTVLGARLVDRFGKGIRGAPRDALIADVTPAEQRGAAYGLRQSMDTVGAVAGPVIAMLLLEFGGASVRTVFAWAVLPAMLAVLVLWLAVREPEARVAGEARPRGVLLRRQDLAALPRAYWSVLLAGGLLALTRGSEAFLVLRVQQQGLALALVPMALVVMNLVYSAVSYPLGWLSDRWPRRRLLWLGLVLLSVSQALLSLPGLGWTVLGIAVYGLHLGATQGVLAALVADHSPSALRGTAFGVFNLVVGLATLIAGGAIGALWTWTNPPLAFMGCAALGIVALCVLPRVLPAERPRA